MSNPLTNIREGMRVVDSSGEEIGTVEWVQLSDEDPDTPEAEVLTADRFDQRRESFVDQFADVFTVDNVPEALRARLRREGFVRLDADGLFAADRYILPEQIRSVDGDRVTLNAAKSELIKR